jgi:hypothetical protein
MAASSQDRRMTEATQNGEYQGRITSATLARVVEVRLGFYAGPTSYEAESYGCRA